MKFSEMEAKLEAKLREENTQAVYHTMNILKKGQDEAKVRKDLLRISCLYIYPLLWCSLSPLVC